MGLWLSVTLHIVSVCQYYACYNPMHPLYGVLPVPYVPVRVTRGVLSHITPLMRLVAAQPCSTAGLLFPGLYLCERSLCAWPRIRLCGTGGFHDHGRCLFIGLASLSNFVSSCFSFLFFHSMGWYCVAGVFGLIGCWPLSPSLALPTFLIIIIIIQIIMKYKHYFLSINLYELFN